MAGLSQVRAYLLRRALGTVGPGAVQDIVDLFGFLGDAVKFGHSKEPNEMGQYYFLPDGRAWVMLPNLANERVLWQKGLHELGHYLCEERPVGDTGELSGAAALLSEQDADDFADAFLLPEDVMDAISCMADAYDLAEEYGISLERIERRREYLQRYGGAELSGPPLWSAWKHYRVGYLRHPGLSRFVLEPVTEHAARLEIAAAPGMYAPTLRAIHWDLASLRLHEFLFKHRADGECSPVECAGMFFEELLPPKRKRRRTWR